MEIEPGLPSFVAEIDKSEYWHIPVAVMKAHASSVPSVNFEHLSWALGYYMPLAVKPEGEIFTPAWEFGNQCFPPRISEITSGVLEDWASDLETFKTSLLIRARISDLLWFFKFGDDPSKFAEIAAETYLAISQDFDWERIYKAVILSRAFQLTLEVQNVDLNLRVRNSIISLVRSSLSSGSAEPGVVLPLIELFVENPFEGSNGVVSNFLEMSEEIYSKNPFILDQVLTIQAASFPEVNNRNIQTKKRIRLWERAALEENGLISILHFQKAISLANASKFKDEVKRLNALLEDHVRQHPAQLQEFPVNFSFDQNQFESYLAQFTSGENMSDSISRIASEIPITPNRDLDDEYVQELMTESPLRFLATKVILNSRGLPLKTLHTPEQIALHDLYDEESRAINLWGSVLIQIFGRLNSKPEEFLTGVYAHLKKCDYFSDNDIHEFMKCFRHFSEGKVHEVIYPALPRIEGVLRNLVENYGLPIFTTRYNDGSNSYIVLGPIIDKLKKIANSNLWAYAHSLLNNRFQLNLRNEYLHGLVGEPSEIHAALILHFILMISLVSSTKQAQSE